MASKYSKQENQPNQSKAMKWDNCPSEILIMILEQVSLPVIAICLFVNKKWNKACQSVLSHRNLWSQLVAIHLPHNGEMLKAKSNGLGWDQIYRNGILWNHLERASFYLMSEPIVDHSVRKLNIYKDNLIVVNSAEVRYFGVNDFKLRKEFPATCLDFVETETIIVQVSTTWDHFKCVKFFGKSNPDHFNIDVRNAKVLDSVTFYRIQDNFCYILDCRGILKKHSYDGTNWVETYIARHFNSSDIISAFNVYNNKMYLLTSTGTVMVVNRSLRNFKTLMRIKMPNRDMPRFSTDYMFHKLGFVFKVNEGRELVYKRYGLFEYPVFTFECPKMTSMLEHGDMVLIGNSDGTIEIFRPRDLRTKKAVNKLSLQMYVNYLTEPAIVAMDIFEDVDIHHLFVSTKTRIFHFMITHYNGDKYMWSEFPTSAQLKMDYNTEGAMHHF